MQTHDHKITVTTSVQGTLEQVWQWWTQPQHITGWYFATDTWHCPRAENDVRVGGAFLFRMEAKDQSFGFDFTGKYTEVAPKSALSYVLDDGRQVDTRFDEKPGEVRITQVFDAETTNPRDRQQQGWQAILDQFAAYARRQA